MHGWRVSGHQLALGWKDTLNEAVYKGGAQEDSCSRSGDQIVISPKGLRSVARTSRQLRSLVLDPGRTMKTASRIPSSSGEEAVVRQYLYVYQSRKYVGPEISRIRPHLTGPMGCTGAISGVAVPSGTVAVQGYCTAGKVQLSVNCTCPCSTRAA